MQSIQLIQSLQSLFFLCSPHCLTSALIFTDYYLQSKHLRQLYCHIYLHEQSKRKNIYGVYLACYFCNSCQDLLRHKVLCWSCQTSIQVGNLSDHANMTEKHLDWQGKHWYLAVWKMYICSCKTSCTMPAFSRQLIQLYLVFSEPSQQKLPPSPSVLLLGWAENLSSRQGLTGGRSMGVHKEGWHRLQSSPLFHCSMLCELAID